MAKTVYAEVNPGMEEGVLEQEYREALVSSGFNLDVINIIIKGMEKGKVIERVGTELDGVFCDTSSGLTSDNE